MITIGQIIKAQGIKGEVKVRPITYDIDRFLKLKEVIINNTSFVVLSSKIRDGFIYMLLDGVCDRNAAESLTGSMLEVERKNALKLPSDKYFIVDLIGCDVFLDEVLLGKLVDIKQYGSADVYFVEGEKKVSFPFLKDLVACIDIAGKIIRLNPRRFSEVAVYED